MIAVFEDIGTRVEVHREDGDRIPRHIVHFSSRYPDTLGTSAVKGLGQVVKYADSRPILWRGPLCQRSHRQHAVPSRKFSEVNMPSQALNAEIFTDQQTESSGLAEDLEIDLSTCRALRYPGKACRVEVLEKFFLTHPFTTLAVLETCQGTAALRGGGSILTFEDAIASEGQDEVWKLALSLCVDKVASNGLTQGQVQDYEILVLLSGYMARETVSNEGSFDPQLGFTCALLRNQGRLLLHSLLGANPVEVQRNLSGMADEDRLIAEFGITPTELGGHLLRAGRLPAVIQDVLTTIPGYLITTSRFCHEDELIIWTDLALALAEQTHREDCGAESFVKRIDILLEELSATHGLKGIDVLSMVKRAARHVFEFESTYPRTFQGSMLADRLKQLTTSG